MLLQDENFIDCPFSNDLLRNLWQKIQQHYRCHEVYVVKKLLTKMPEDLNFWHDVEVKAREYIEKLRTKKPKALSIESFLQIYQLSSQEGMALMCLAESLLRIPDNNTKNRLIKDKANCGSWENSSEKLMLGQVTNWGMLAVNKILNLDNSNFKIIGGLVKRFGESLIRTIMVKIVQTMGQQFVAGKQITEAINNVKPTRKIGYSYSFDMLGEGAKNAIDADRYFQSYLNALEEIGHSFHNSNYSVTQSDSISVKLSAIYPRYEMAKYTQVMTHLLPKILFLAQKAKELGVSLTIDAEESERLMLSLEIFYKIYTDPSLAGWGGLGLAVQAYQKRAIFVIDWLKAVATMHKENINVRLVKGAYWDSEIKATQEKGLDNYAVFTKKYHTDLSYFACAKKLLQGSDYIYPQFATHNAYTLAFVESMAKSCKSSNFEYQRLYGMGESLYQDVTDRIENSIPCRVYAPVGEHKDLLSYLVRRMLENGANNSFVNKIYNKSCPIEELLANPVSAISSEPITPHKKIPLPIKMLPDRHNSVGVDLSDETFLQYLDSQLSLLKDFPNPLPSTEQQINEAVSIGITELDYWQKLTVVHRAEVVERIALSLQSNMIPLIYLLTREGLKTISDAVSEIREAIDFCYYYAKQARHLQENSIILPSPTGEVNQLSYHGRGVFVCISPWNFPLAIFVGQIVAALVAGNCVIAKPASQTSKIADYAIGIMYQCGVPKKVLQLLITDRASLAKKILPDSRIAGVAFTGSTASAREINHILANHTDGGLPVFIAETGGINVMIADSSALTEQVVNDVIISAFHSAGQRCSALKILLLQEDMADVVITMLTGAMQELTVAEPWLLSTDVGPVIDENAKIQLEDYISKLKADADAGITKLHSKTVVPLDHQTLHFIAPQLWEVPKISYVNKEVFGPILHVVRFKSEQLSAIIQQVNNLGYGLTMGVHSRLESTVQSVVNQAKVGNVYINRTMIGAVVGVQPFGGEGLSGTGFKAGGPNYLLKFVTERVFTKNTTASGGNASLLADID